jgi:hypothetical protein
MISTPHFDVTRIAFESLWRVWRLRREIAFVMLLPAAAVGVLTYFMFQSTAPANAPVRWVAYAARTVVLAIAAVSCHRLILLGSRSVARFGASGWSTREWMFLLLVAAVSAIATVASMLTSAASALVLSISFNLFDYTPGKGFVGVVAVLAILAGAYALARVSLVLPARAVDEPMGFRESFTLTKPHAWRLAIVVALLPWAMAWLERLLAMSFESAGAYWTISTALYLLLLPVEIALLSESYRTLKTARST